jgi:peptidoglycan/LPS O-acetylase OafA/YrhL
MVALNMIQVVFQEIAPFAEHLAHNPVLFSVGDGWALQRNAIALFPHFLTGFLAAIVYLDLRKRMILSHEHPLRLFQHANKSDLMIVGGTIASALLFLVVPHQTYSWPIFHGFIAILLVLVPFSLLFGKIIDNRFTKGTAKISYGIYLWHVPCLNFARSVWPNHTPKSFMEILVFVITGIVITYAVATASYLIIERPVQNWVRKRVRIAT